MRYRISYYFFFATILLLNIACVKTFAMGEMPSPKSIAVNTEKVPKQNASEQALVVNASHNSCEEILDGFNRKQLNSQINVAELVQIVRSLEHNNKLPQQFITKRQAERLGWTPGTYFENIEALKGKSIGGDRFGNYEKRLPRGQWREADLGYQGKKRKAKRLLFAFDGQRYVTIDHYKSFKKVPACQ